MIDVDDRVRADVDEIYVMHSGEDLALRRALIYEWHHAVHRRDLSRLTRRRRKGSQPKCRIGSWVTDDQCSRDALRPLLASEPDCECRYGGRIHEAGLFDEKPLVGRI